MRVPGQPGQRERRAMVLARPADEQLVVGGELDVGRRDVVGDRRGVDEALGHRRMAAGRAKAVVAQPEVVERGPLAVIPGQHQPVVEPLHADGRSRRHGGDSTPHPAHGLQASRPVNGDAAAVHEDGLTAHEGAVR